jgi:hypothetical protein
MNAVSPSMEEVVLGGREEGRPGGEDGGGGEDVRGAGEETVWGTIVYAPR